MLTSVWELTNMYKQLTFKSRPTAVLALDLEPPPSSLHLIEGSCCLCPFPSAEGWDIDGMFPQYHFRLVLFYNSFSLGGHVDHWDVWVLVMSTPFSLSLGVMWIIGMGECLSWVLPSQDAGGGHVVSGCVPCITWAGPPKPSCIKGQSEVDHVGQMGCTGAYQ